MQVPYVHIVQAVYLRPWAIRREVHDQIRAIVKVHVEKGHLAEDEVREQMAAAPQRPGRGRGLATVARIPIHGVIIPRASMFAEMSGATSIETLRERFRAALDDSEVDGIVFDVDSPGGIVDGVPEMAAEIRAARGRKPMAAVANTIAASAAYWLASQADEIAVTPSGEAGSIGVFSAHEDWSKFWDEVGVKTTLISAGKFKVEGNQYEPLGDEAQAHFQSLTDDYYGMFVRDVAAGRNTSAGDVREGYGQGRMLTAKRAITEKLADRVATLEETELRIARQGAASRTQRDREALGDGMTFQSIDIGEAPPLAITDRQVELEEEEAAADPDHDAGDQVDEDEVEASSPSPEYYALRARRRDRGSR